MRRNHNHSLPGIGAGAILRLLLAACLGGVPSVAAADGQDADELFAAGRLADALAGYQEVHAGEPEDRHILLRLGRLLLWRGQYTDARPLLDRAHELAADEESAELLLELVYRRGDFEAAARWAAQLNRPAQAAQFAHLAEPGPYRLVAGPAETTLPFLQTDPLPFVELSINDSEPALFLIDTGGGELILDPELARAVGAERFGSRTGTFAADQTAEVEYGAIDRVRLGEFVVENVPVRLLATGRFAGLTGGKPVAGILGTLLLAQFQFTIDYPGERLRLRRLDAEPAASTSAVRVPYWLAADHLILAEGAINDGDPLLVLVDTGLAGGGFAAPPSTLSQAKIAVAGDTVVGEGGGGRVHATTVTADRLRLGELEGRDVPGFAGVFPASLEHKLGCRIGALFSHAFLRPYAITFDPAKSEIRAVRP